MLKYYKIGGKVIELDTGEKVLKPYYKFSSFAFEAPEHFMPDLYIHIDLKDIIKPAGSHFLYQSPEYDCLLENKERIYKINGKYYARFIQETRNRFLLEIDRSYSGFASSENYLFNLLCLENVYLDYNGLFLHSSLIKYHSDGIAFFAPSGTGKTTQAMLWEKYTNATVINGDRSLLKLEGYKWRVYGIPYSGSSEYCVNDSCNLKALIYLEQAKTNTLEKLTQGAAARKIYSQISVNSWNPDYVERCLNLIEHLTSNIPVYLYKCTKEEDAVSFLKSRLYGD